MRWTEVEETLELDGVALSFLSGRTSAREGGLDPPGVECLHPSTSIECARHSIGCGGYKDE